GGHQPDSSSNAIAVGLERGEIGIPVIAQVHLHAVDDFLKVLLRKIEIPYYWNQRLSDRVLRGSAEGSGDFRAPPGELGARQINFFALVHYIVDLAAKCVK